MEQKNLHYKPFYHDLAGLMTERRLVITLTIIMRWVQRHAPEPEKRRNRHARKVVQLWRADETMQKSCRNQLTADLLVL